jgi:hypothetical protein
VPPQPGFRPASRAGGPPARRPPADAPGENPNAAPAWTASPLRSSPLRALALPALAFLLLAFPGHAAPPAPTGRPVTEGDHPTARQLQAWWADGTAAGNESDWYDNRDGGHSMLDLAGFPQVREIRYTDEQKGRQEHWGASRAVRRTIVVGNSSTAALPQNGGSIGRRLYSAGATLDLLHRQYRANQLYVYPEHLDHDSGRNGSPGWGDLFPANTPYLVVSQGSSLSDQPFVRTLFWTLAAFRPETKQLLATNGLLMPTVQMLLRLGSRPVGSTNLYLTGVAHPTAFDPADLDPETLAALAHSILPQSLPPLAQVKVVSETTGPAEVDFFAGAATEKLADTPGAVARIWRGNSGVRRMVLSAESSFDLNHRPLTFHWVPLRGGPAALTIRPLNPQRSVVEATFRWTGRRPITPGATLESARTDLGVFVHNGTWWSAPAFVTWYASDRDRRAYGPDDRPLVLTYDGVAPRIEVPLLTPVLDWLATTPPPPGARVFRQLAGAALLERLHANETALRAAEALVRSNTQHQATLRTALADAQRRLAERRPTSPPAETLAALELAVREATKLLSDADAALARAVEAANRLSNPGRQALIDTVTAWIDDPAFARKIASELPTLRSHAAPETAQALDATDRQARAVGLRPGPDPGTYALPAGAGLGSPETDALLRCHIARAALLFPPAVQCRMAPFLVDTALFPRFAWTDVYRHDASGRFLGWQRHGPTGLHRFTADGYLVLREDPTGRPLQATDVRYTLDAFNRGSRTYQYQFEGPDDLRGRPSPLP